ncbi:pyridoxal kinase [Magnaporthiopsis poae ATCC 64411]|uniref:pyridoxal kinase n=1 Tax=Magnaporthiopsis poae (strain ATCC 64411 / 73-15) TaxID=644358 RepID=A0A0C4E2N6_MAGP6|nr:pyridoxal kinase [Magnaporthiopsis poae ATCC 64411]
MSSLMVPETRVLAVASHVVSGNVGNKIAVFTMQSLGCEVAALNTVQFSNHTGYKQWKGTRVSADEISDLWEGLKQSYLDGFDMMLSGYIPGAAAVEAVGRIAVELKAKAKAGGSAPGSFFWVLDPVMGDNGTLYVAPDVVPAYKALLRHADLILPNQFEAEVLSEVEIVDAVSLERAVGVLHARSGVPHVIITSVSLPHPDHPEKSMWVVGSTRTSDGQPRMFKIVFPAIDCYFSGTGDMFAALMVARMREAVHRDTTTQAAAAATTVPLGDRASWISDDSVEAVDLPLARAAEKVLATMHEVLTKTLEGMEAEMARVREKLAAAAAAEGAAASEEEQAKVLRLHRSRAAELRLVRNLESLRNPNVAALHAVKM